MKDVPQGYKGVCLKTCNNIWKNYKNKLKDKFFKPNKDDPELSSKCPENVVPEQWVVLVAYWCSAEVEVQRF